MKLSKQNIVKSIKGGDIVRLKHFFIMILMFSIFWIAGCAEDVDGETDDMPPAYSGVVMINDMEYEMENGHYTWEIRKGLGAKVVTTDHASPNQMAKEIEPITTNPNQKVKIEIEEDPNITVYLWNEEEVEKEIEMDANQITVPVNKGKYIYEALAEWKDGKISYTFVVEVQ